MNIVMSTNHINTINDLIKHLYSIYEYHAKLSNIKDKQLILEQIMSLIHTCLLALSKSALPQL